MKTQSMMLLLAFLLSSSFNFSHATEPVKQKSRSELSAMKLSVKIRKDQGLRSTRGAEGAFTAEASGGTPPYQYKWSTGCVQNYVNGLSAGIYTLKVIDASGSSIQTSAEVSQFDCSTAQCQFRTQTQGGWGTNPHGNNPGVYLDANFAAAFPAGLTVGCNNTLKLTSAQAVRDFLPSGTTPRALPAGMLTDPGSTYRNVLAGQVVALTLSVGFDNYDPNFALPAAHLSSLVIASGTFAGMTVQQALDEANKVLGGCASPYSASQVNSVISSINENFVDGTTDQGFLLCQPAVLMISAHATPESCYGSCDGTAFVQISGGTAPFSIIWSNQATGSSISNLCPGTFDVMVEDALGCIGMASVTINSASQLSVNANGTDISCFGANDGSASASVSGGVAPFSFDWSNGGSSANLMNLEPGSYTVIVTDAHQCTGSASITIVEPRLLAAAASAVDASCLANDGSISAQASGGTMPYSFLWSPGGATGSAVSNVGAGVYSVLVTDAHGCTATAETIVQGSPLQLSLVSVTPVSCPGEDDGSATVMATGGTAPYTYNWFPYGGTSATATNLVAGHYIVRIEDYFGCPSFIIVEVGILNPSCNFARFGRSTVTEGGLTLFPNPSSEIVNIYGKSGSETSTLIEMIDMTGRIIYSTTRDLKNAVQEPLNIKSIPSGLYLVKVTSSTGTEIIRFNKN